MSDRQDSLEIRDVIENWAVWRDAGDWDRFQTVWGEDGYMSATWFQGPATEFIAASRKGFENGVRILHFLGGASIDVRGDRAIGQTKMTITQRVQVHDVDVDVVCTGRFYDFFERRDATWKLIRRQPIYEQDRLDVIDPALTITLVDEELNAYPVGYRHLAYVQLAAGFDVKKGLPGLTGEATNNLYAEGRAWLDGVPNPGVLL
jgi:hypothetical protein